MLDLKFRNQTKVVGGCDRTKVLGMFQRHRFVMRHAMTGDLHVL
jgi:hypothetical protein